MVKHPSNGYVNWKVFILAVTAFIGLFSLGWGRQESQAKELKALQMWQSAMDERMGNLIDDVKEIAKAQKAGFKDVTDALKAIRKLPQ